MPAIATSGDEGLEIARNGQPDVCLVDVGLPDQSGLVVASAIKQAAPSTRIIVLTGISDPRLAEQSLRSGFAYMTKQTPVRRVIETVRTVAEGRASVPERSAPRRPERTDEALLADQLTSREREVLRLLVEGLNGSAIARRLRISSNTVRTHIQSILTKLQVHSRLGAATFAVRHGLVPRGRARRGV